MAIAPHRFSLLPTAGFAALLATSASASVEGAPPLRLMALSGDLFSEGMREEDPLLLITAARLRKAAGVEAPSTLDWHGMLANAERFSAGDSALLALIADVAASNDRGVTMGPVHVNAALAGAGVGSHGYDFKGGQIAEVYLEGPAANDSAPGGLRLVVEDATGHVICADSHPSNIAYCSWTPAQDGSFRVTVEGATGSDVSYVLITN